MEPRFRTPPRLQPVVGTPCIAPCGCDRPAVARGLCTGHHHQERRGQPLVPLRFIRSAMARDPLGRKECGTCRVFKPVSEFGVDHKQSDHLLNVCRRCARSATLLRKYGITADEFDTIVESQGGVCAICRVPSDRELVVDHDHDCCPGTTTCTRCRRGIICTACNLALGMVRHEISRLEAMVVYLDRRPAPRVLRRTRIRQIPSGPARRSVRAVRETRVMTRP